MSSKYMEADFEIDGYRLELTSMACPEQYDVFDSAGQQVGYLRLRHGYFRADVPTHGGETVYAADTQGDGMFDSDERLPQLCKAISAIKAFHTKGLDNAALDQLPD